MDVQWPGLPTCQLTAVTQKDGRFLVSLLVPTPAECACGSRRVKTGQVTATVHDLPRGNDHVQLRLQATRWRCPRGCKGKPWDGIKAEVETPAGVIRPTLSQRLWEEVLDLYRRGWSVASLVRWCGVDTQTLARLLSESEQKQVRGRRGLSHLRAVTHIGLDEKFWQGRVLCVVVDLSTGRLLDLLPDREPDTLREFLQEFHGIHGGHPVFVMDMWEPFRQVVKEVYGPRARIVADRFHIVAKIGEDLNDVVRLFLPPSRKRPRQLAAVNARYLSSLKGRQAAPIPRATAAERELINQAVALACQAHRLWESKTVEAFRRAHLDWEWEVFCFTRQANADRGLGAATPFGRLQYLLRLWSDEIYAYCDPELALMAGGQRVRPSNGRTEGVNAALARFLQRSGHRRRVAFARWDLADTWNEQSQFERLWLRVMWSVNVQAEKPEIQQGRVRSAVFPCGCGEQAGDVSWSAGDTVYDLPLGQHPVRSVVEVGHWTCPACGTSQTTERMRDALTPRLRAFLQSERQRGCSWSQLHRLTGVPLGRLKKTVNAPEQPHRPAMPQLIGIQRFRWRRNLHWVIVDPRTNQLVDLLPDGDGPSLSTWLSAQHAAGLEQVMVASLAWCSLVPPPLERLVDRFGCMAPVHHAHREVQWRWSAGLSVARKRAPLLSNHRFILLANPGKYRRIDHLRRAEEFDLRRPGLLGEDGQVNEAYRLVTQFRDTVLTAPSVETASAALTAWVKCAQDQVKQREHCPSATTGRSFHFAFQRACRELQENGDAIAGGLALQSSDGVSLGGAARLIRSLKALPGAHQSDFDFFRASALTVLGAP